MKHISVIWQNRNGLGGDRKMVIATNDDGSGLFYRAPSEGSYHQMAGNCQTPTFRSATQMVGYLRRHYYTDGNVRIIRGSAIGWPTGV